MKHYFFTILIAMSVTSSMAQFSLSGKITTKDGRPLEGANVIVEKMKTGTITDHEGKFTLTDLPKNEKLTTVCSFLGYLPEKRTITLQSDYYIEIELEEQVYIAQEVIVSALRASENTPVSHQTIDYKTIKEKNSGQEIPYLLQLTPSLVASSDAGTGIGYSSFRIRGVDMTRINITINDIPLNDAESHSVFLVNMPDFVESVNSIQIQ
ncbi:MAG TPA: TonB-dependent receptor, partial [Salinivirgaceae bacterium]|nr:TonB-dependent receptor [Salinivirgaceae bacterium]